MNKFLLFAAATATLAGSACSKAEDCTSEMLTQKAQEMTTALQEAVAKDPAKASDLAAKVQEITSKYQGANTSKEACKAYDELISAIKS